MTHFMVMVRLPGTVEDIDTKVKEVLAPFKEYDGDYAQMKPYLEFIDTHDEDLERYQTGGVERIRLPGGTLLSPYDDRFRVGDTFGLGPDTHQVPPGLDRVEVPYNKEYTTFDEFQKEFTGNDALHPETGRYGHWKNPRGYWNWWAIGGRYADRLPIIGTASMQNIARIAGLDFEAADQARRKRALDWLNRWSRYRLGEQFSWEDCPRDIALRMGVMTCADEDEITGDEIQIIPWKKRHGCADDAPRRHDVVLREVTNEDVERSPLLDTFDPIRPAARLDATVPSPEWTAPGKFGWFGSRSDTPEEFLAYAEGFRPWLASGDQQDKVVVVDCHA